MEEKYRSSFYGVITSLCLDNNLLYSGKGNYLDIYNIENDSKIGHIKVFPSNKILKITIFELNKIKKLIIFAGETKIVFSYLINNILDTNFYNIETFSEDYIVDCVLIRNENNEIKLVLGFINNYIEIHIFEENSNKFKFKKTVFSPKKCIVYSMSIIHSDKNNILVASGTVFSEIIIWEVDIKNLCKTEKNNITLKGHEGVIFSVNFINKKLLISTSDDRTSRLWEINYENNNYVNHTFYGHNSRVWNAKVNLKNNILVSISEDATARVYNIETKKYIFECVNGHIGKNIRSIELNDNFIWTGGEDGQIIKWKINIENTKVERKIDNNIGNDLFFSYILSDQDNQCLLAKQKQKNFTPAIKFLKFLNCDNLLLGSNHGQILILNLITKNIDKILFNDKETRVINSIDIILNKFVFVGLSDGNIQLIEIDNFQKNSKTINIFHNIRITFIGHKIFNENNEMFIILSTALGQSKIFYFENINLLKFEDIIDKMNLNNNNYLTYNTGVKYPIGISSFELVRYNNIQHLYMLFLGDYGGRIYFSQLKKISNQIYNFNNNIKFNQIHNDGKITNIIFSYNDNILYTFGRDGRIKKFIIINLTKMNFSIKEIDSIYKNDISSYEIVLYNAVKEIENSNYFILGHHGRNLLIYNANSKLIIHTNDVKGVNRPLDAYLCDKNLSIKYAVSHANKVSIYEILNENKNKNLINNGFIYNYSNPIHGRLIHDSNIICVDKINKFFLICTCSEDTKVNFFLIQNINSVFQKNENLNFIAQFSMHQCAVRKINIIEIINEKNNDKRVKEIIFMSIGSKCECFLFKLILNSDIKNCKIFLLKDFTKRNYKKNKNEKIDIENTRNLDLTHLRIVEKNIKNYYLFVSNTLGITNSYKYIIEENDSLIIKDEDYKNITSNFIPLSINHVVKYLNEIYLIYGLTNGNLNIVNIENKIDLYYKLHESGINNLKIINGLKDNIYIIISCGEDCSLGISELDINNDIPQLNLIKKIRNIHYSAIKSISIEQIDQNNYFIISSSYDQLLNIISFNILTNEIIKIERIKCIVSEINTVSTLIYENKILICVGGQGIELIEKNI